MGRRSADPAREPEGRKPKLSIGSEAPKSYLAKLRKFVAAASHGTFTDDDRIKLETFVKASLAKAFEFCIYAYGPLNREFAFHCVGGLRSICEDLIVLKFISTLPREDQKLLLAADMARAIQNGMRYQKPFFETFRLGQPVLRGAYPPEALMRLNDSVDEAWRRHGWARASNGKWPPIEQLARKIGPGTVDVIYDYIFRLTSSTVHFNTRALLRTGWGSIRSDGTAEFRFSTKNMSTYYVAFCQVYGVFLLTIYFEFFADILGVDPVVERHVQGLRLSLARENRWPEMFTFEEANRELPRGGEIMRYAAQQVLAEEFKGGFIAGAERLKAERSRVRKQEKLDRR